MMVCAGSSLTLSTKEVSLRTYGEQPSSRAESNYARKECIFSDYRLVKSAGENLRVRKSLKKYKEDKPVYIRAWK